MLKLSYTWRIRLYLVAGAIVTIAFGLVAGSLSRIGDEGEYFWLIFPALLVLAMGLAWFVYIWLRALDDVQKAGQVNSWYWGGCIGALVFILYLVADRAQHSEYGQGAFAMFGAQFVGFVVMWGVWKLRGMVRAE
ncbi:MAG: hypothetical protein QNI87_10690 [Erythrobacter sp.]|uniref:hypothetical protein n=1 Tax=Erythrobacter sp. TaxID=1042 RepID=UPI00260DD67B|nr:hypothetical protein [Erythrobacter sp.]MDJ0978987.1 hypothetical protein [Erythrobacter sp.]